MNDKATKEDRLTLELLNAIDQHSDLSQRHLASHLGVALGLANSYLKRCVRKGFVKISEAPANRYLYYLTPNGFTEKTRLTAQYLSASFSFYREAGTSCARAYDGCRARGLNRILLCGLSDLAEIAFLRGMEQDVEIVGIYDPRAERARFFSRPVWKELEQAAAYDACLVTDLARPLATYRALIAQVERARVFVPDVLGLNDVSVLQ